MNNLIEWCLDPANLKWLFLILMVLVVASLFLFSYLSERKKWNKGICRESGKAWHYEYSELGCRRYFSSKKNITYSCYISWKSIDRGYKG